MWPFSRITLVHYATLSMVAFALWQIAMGAAVLYLERDAHAAVDASGPSVSLVSVISGGVVLFLSGLVQARKNFGRQIAVYWFLLHSSLFLFGPIATDANNPRELAVTIGAAPLWLTPLLLALLLVNNQLTAEFAPQTKKRGITRG